MGSDGLEIAALGELGEAVAEVTDAGEDEFLLGVFVRLSAESEYFGRSRHLGF